VVRFGINPMIEPEPEDLPKDNPKLEIAVLRIKKKCMDKGCKQRSPPHNLRQKLGQYICCQNHKLIADIENDIMDPVMQCTTLPSHSGFSQQKLVSFVTKIHTLSIDISLRDCERILEGPEMIEVTNEKVAVAREKLKEAQTRQKSYADRHRRALEFQPGEHVFLKISPTRGVRRFGIKGKLSPRFIGPFEILDRVGEVSYRLALPPQLSHVHNVFHVSLLRGYKYHPLHVVSYPFDQIREDLSYTEEPESILDRQDRVMRNKTIPFVKILWRNHPEREATWETEESIRTSYPHFLP
ncbi:putative nucleotidyltransferase, ribonuclease H, partial [Tanacetum coccineum]